MDQLTKVLAQTYLTPRTSLPLLRNIFHLTLVENQGIAFGLFQGAETLLLVVISLSILILAAVGFRISTRQGTGGLAISLILGGALGNWIDRIRVGAVIDFLDFRIWPVFNLADTAITVGVGIFLLDIFKIRRGQPSSNVS